MVPRALCFSIASGNTQVFKLRDGVNVFCLGFGRYIVFSLSFCLGDAHVSNLLLCNKNAFFLALLLGLFGYLFLLNSSK